MMATWLYREGRNVYRASHSAPVIRVSWERHGAHEWLALRDAQGRLLGGGARRDRLISLTLTG